MSRSDELWRWNAIELAHAIRTRQISSQEAVASCLQRIEAVNPALNAVVDVMADQAMRQARASDEALARGDAAGLLQGVPVTVKINVDFEGAATTNGVEAFKSVIATEDSPVVANLRRAGAVFLGRTNTPAFSVRWFTDNDAHGRTLNPWDASITPGGSSGGASSAVAAGMGPIAHGNDQGGSIRYPAYACGVVGLRPTLGRVPAYVHSSARERPIMLQLSSVQGPLTRCVADARLALQAMAARDWRDPWWTPIADRDPASFPRRVALCRSVTGFAGDPLVDQALIKAAACLSDAGYEIEEVEPPRLYDCSRLWLDLTMNEGRHFVLDTVNRLGDEAIRRANGGIDAAATTLDLPGFMDALALRATLLREWMAFFERYPLLLMPVSWERPFPIDLDQQGQAAIDRILLAQSPLHAPAVLGLPGLAVPVGVAQGIPLGVQLVAGRFDEALCLAAGEAIEARCGVLAPVDPH